MESMEGSDQADSLPTPAENLAMDLLDFGDSSLAPATLDALDQSMREIDAMDWSSDAWNIGDMLENNAPLSRQEFPVEYGDSAAHPNAENTNARADSVFEPNTERDPPFSNTEFADITQGEIADVFDETLFEDFELPKRQLRPQCRQKQLFGTTWLDNDETGNYDPVQEKKQERQERIRRTRARVIQRVHHACDAGSAESSETEKPCGVEEVPSLPVTLHFKTQTGKVRFAQKLQDHEQELDSDQKGYKLRRHVNEAQTTATGCEKLGEIDTSAKPFARGCYACVALYGTSSDQHCSLIDNETDWPCTTCRGDDTDCELITPPIRKLACETCKNHRVACSYNTTRNQGKSCDRCALFSHHCIAGPAKAFIRPRLRYERDWERDPYPQAKRRKNGDVKPLPPCEECRTGSRQCKYPQDEDGHFRRACWNCLEESLPCTIHVKGAPREQKLPASESADNLVTINNKPALPPPPPPRKGPMATRNLTTSFSHPIIFNCDDNSQLKKSSPQKEKNKPCHFCTEPALAFFGFGLVNAEVVEFPGVSGFMELSNGHRARSVEQTRLCTVCTLHRMSIVMCDKHAMQPIIGADTVTPEAREQALDRLLDGKLSQEDVESYCSLCTNHASYVCAAEMDEEVPGCGLKLCEPCVLTLQGQHDGDLEKMLRRGSKLGPSEERPLGLRADVELLKEDGALMLHLKELSKQ